MKSTAFDMAMVAYRQNDMEGAFRQFLSLAESQDADALNMAANMFERAGVYQTFGLNVELNDTATITARLLKNSANITVSVDYVMLQPAQTAITSL